jgi:hypothetical protein
MILYMSLDVQLSPAPLSPPSMWILPLSIITLHTLSLFLQVVLNRFLLWTGFSIFGSGFKRTFLNIRDFPSSAPSSHLSFHLFLLIDIFVVEIFFHGSYPIHQFFSIQVAFIHWDLYLGSSSQSNNRSQQEFINDILPCILFDFYFFTFCITDVPSIKCSPLHCLHHL